jgi:hypothetical protein
MKTTRACWGHRFENQSTVTNKPAEATRKFCKHYGPTSLFVEHFKDMRASSSLGYYGRITTINAIIHGVLLLLVHCNYFLEKKKKKEKKKTLSLRGVTPLKSFSQFEAVPKTRTSWDFI